MIFIGDTHGNMGYVRMIIENYDYRNMDLIHVGDFGVGFMGMDKEIRDLEELNDFMRNRGLTLHVIRGNHDNPNYFDGTYMYTNLKLHTDYTIINVEDKNILLVGGAISIDRVPRRRYNTMAITQDNHTEKRYHWEDEKFVLDREKLEGIKGVNIVVTHTAPHFAKPFDTKGNWPYIVKQFMGEDPTLGDDLVAERLLLTEMYNILNKNNYIEDWFYGHFHRNQFTNHEATLFHMLGINEVREYGNFDEDEEDRLTEQYDPNFHETKVIDIKKKKNGQPDMRYKKNKELFIDRNG